MCLKNEEAYVRKYITNEERKGGRPDRPQPFPSLRHPDAKPLAPGASDPDTIPTRPLPRVERPTRGQ